MSQKFDNVYVDVPDKNGIGEADNSWVNVANFTTVEDAVKWIRDNIGHCDDAGNVRLITTGTPIEDRVS